MINNTDVDLLEVEVEYIRRKDVDGLPDHFKSYPTYFPQFLSTSRDEFN